MMYETITVEQQDRVALVTLHRPQAMNAISNQLLRELTDAMALCDADATVGALVITGGAKVFAAGADIGEMHGVEFADAFLTDGIGGRGGLWKRFNACRKPVIAAVSGYALGAGCELAMACDILLCDTTAKFGQPEIKLAAIPGAGGTQRLARYIGKSKAMEVCLGARLLDAIEAERCGLVSRVLTPEALLEDAMATAAKIAAYSLPCVLFAKEAVNTAFETSLTEGLRFERRAFLATYALGDRQEGVKAFIEKRAPAFNHR